MFWDGEMREGRGLGLNSTTLFVLLTLLLTFPPAASQAQESELLSQVRESLRLMMSSSPGRAIFTSLCTTYGTGAVRSYVGTVQSF